MKILIAPDSLKGSLSAIDFCQIAARQIKQLQPEADVHMMPLADGGEGTIDAILANSQGKKVTISVHNALRKPIMADYAILEDQNTAVIEMAQASGLPQIKSYERDPLKATSFGTGELIIDALNHGCRRFIIGLGGSATNDGGSGMLQAMGVKFYDIEQQPVQACGGVLHLIDSIDISMLDPRIKESEIIIAGDVTNHLLGEQGATTVFGPQKGADKTSMAILENGLRHFAEQTEQLPGFDVSCVQTPGAGAAGGMGFALMAYCQARMESGFELIAQLARLDSRLESELSRPDLIITGEGQFDQQSLHGKLVGRLVSRSEQYQIPLLVICGSIGHDVDMTAIKNSISVFSLCDGPMTLEYAMENSDTLLKNILLNLSKVIFNS